MYSVRDNVKEGNLSSAKRYQARLKNVLGQPERVAFFVKYLSMTQVKEIKFSLTETEFQYFGLILQIIIESFTFNKSNRKKGEAILSSIIKIENKEEFEGFVWKILNQTVLQADNKWLKEDGNLQKAQDKND